MKTGPLVSVQPHMKDQRRVSSSVIKDMGEMCPWEQHQLPVSWYWRSPAEANLVACSKVTCYKDSRWNSSRLKVSVKKILCKIMCIVITKTNRLYSLLLAPWQLERADGCKVSKTLPSSPSVSAIEKCCSRTPVVELSYMRLTGRICSRKCPKCKCSPNQLEKRCPDWSEIKLERSKNKIVVSLRLHSASGGVISILQLFRHWRK